MTGLGPNGAPSKCGVHRARRPPTIGAHPCVTARLTVPTRGTAHVTADGWKLETAPGQRERASSHWPAELLVAHSVPDITRCITRLDRTAPVTRPPPGANTARFTLNHPASVNPALLPSTLTTLFTELVDGAPESGAYMLNSGDPGLLRSLGRLSAADASAASTGGASVAAHVEHVRYGLSLMNRWMLGTDPFADADWAASWPRTTVTDAEWEGLRADLDAEAHRWLAALGTPRDVTAPELAGIVASVAHLAYHLGAIRQIARAARGPAADT